MGIHGTEMGKVYAIQAYLIIHRGPQRPAWHPLCALGRLITPGGANVQETTAGLRWGACMPGHRREFVSVLALSV